MHPENKPKEELVELLNAYQKAIDVNIISSITNAEGIITYVNRKFCEVSQYDRAELIGKSHNIVNSYYHPAEFFGGMWQTIRRGTTWHGEIRNKAKDGSYYWVDTVILPITDKSGSIKEFLSLRTLITERKTAEALQQEYTEKLKDIVNMTSHRVRSPLSSCLGLLNIIDSGDVRDEAELKRIIAHLKSSAQQLDKFTKDLTEYLVALEKKYDQPGPGMLND